MPFDFDPIPAKKSDEFAMPDYRTPGRVLVCIYSNCYDYHYRYDLDVLDHDENTSVFWIHEGTGFSYWFDKYVDLELPGYYVIEGVTGTVWTDSWGEADVEWHFERCRRASDEEIATECLA